MMDAAHRCPNCEQPIPAAYLHTSVGDITCPACKASHFRAKDLSPADVPRLRRDVSIPRGMSVTENKKRLYISYNWFNPVYLFAVLVAGTYLFTMGYAVYVGLQLASVQVSLIAVPALAGGIIYAYFLLAQMFNNTHIVVSGTDVLVFQSPLPLPKSRREVVADVIEQLYLLQHEKVTTKGARYYVYDVVMIHDGQYVTLVHNLRKRRLALAIEAEIEAYLNLPDEPVYGSVRP